MGFTRFAQNDLARLSYELSPADHPDVDPALVPAVALLHATLADRASLAPLRDTLLDQVTLVQPDARGHGGSAALTDRSFTVTDMANDLYAVLEAAGLLGADTPPVHLIGHGQGAIAALELARRRPDLVASLVLIEPDAPSLLDGELDGQIVLWREEARMTGRQAADAAYKGLTEAALSGYLDRRWGTDWRTRLSKPRLAAVRRHAAALAPSLDALDRYYLLPEELAAIAVPTLVVVAAESPAAERAIARRLADAMPTATFRAVTSLPGGAPFSGNGEVALAIVVDWLNEHA
ncbi:MAG TPA: alpha/beta hydrolase [Thermomicrobiales bacterium]|nr:alpha/beta hydrolase [Thermomicrobiales bacterium]